MNADSNIITLDLRKAGAALERKRTLLNVRDGRGNPVKGVYQYPDRKGYYIRPRVDGRPKTIKLKATTLAAAELARANKISALAKYHEGLGKNPFARSGAVPLAELCAFYLAKGCPGKRGEPRLSISPAQLKQLNEEKRRVRYLSTWPAAKESFDLLNAERWRQYHAWRIKRNESGRGDRAVDLERNTLSNILRTAIRNASELRLDRHAVESLEKTWRQMLTWEKFRDSTKVRHCRDAMPRTGDELHSLARYAFNSGFLRKAVPNKCPRGTKGTRRWQLQNQEVFGWVALFAAAVGHRITALLTLRTDATNENEPGYVRDRQLFLYRSHTHKGTAGHCDISRDFQKCIDAHRAWLKLRCPDSPWYFPSPFDPMQPLDPDTFRKWLTVTCKALALPHRTPHGLRAFRVNVLRGQGKSDAEIAIIIAHKSGVKLIVGVYGEGLPYKLSWMPAKGTQPAWEDFESLETFVPTEPLYVQQELGLSYPINR